MWNSKRYQCEHWPTGQQFNEREGEIERERVQKKIYIQQSIQLDKWSEAVDTNITTGIRFEITERRQAAAVAKMAFIWLCFVRCVTGYFFMFFFYIYLFFIFSFTFALATSLRFCHAAHLSRFHLSHIFESTGSFSNFTAKREKTQQRQSSNKMWII